MVGVCVAAVIFAGWLLFERLRGQAALRNYEKQLRAKGEKLTFAEVTPRVPEGENRAIELANLFFRTGAVLIANAPPAVRCVAPGKAWVITRETEWFGEKGRRFSWEQVGEDLERNREALDELRETVRAPVLRYPLQYRGMSTLLPHLARLKNAAQWLSASALYKIRIGDIKGAVDDLESVLLATRLVEHEPIVISQLVRNAVITIAVNNCWPLLQADNLNDGELARLQVIFERIDPIGPMILGLQGERAMGRDAVELIRSTPVNVNDFVDAADWFDSEEDAPQALEKLPYGEEMQGAVRLYILYPVWRFAFSHADEKHLLEEMQGIIDTARTATADKSAHSLEVLDKRVRAKTRPGGEFRSWRYFATGLAVPDTAGSAARAFRGKTQCNIAVAAIALKRYHLRHKKYPASLTELVPEFVSEVPVDYMDGKPLRYRLDGDQFVLWSVGRYGTDDGGTPNPKGDFGWLQGPDNVWPQPASPAEVAKYREEQTKKR
jgi:hypothetical protein